MNFNQDSINLNRESTISVESTNSLTNLNKVSNSIPLKYEIIASNESVAIKPRID